MDVAVHPAGTQQQQLEALKKDAAEKLAKADSAVSSRLSYSQADGIEEALANGIAAMQKIDDLDRLMRRTIAIQQMLREGPHGYSDAKLHEAAENVTLPFEPSRKKK